MGANTLRFALGALLLAGCADDMTDANMSNVCVTPRAWGTNLVIREGEQLTLDGQPYVARGINSYPLLQLTGAGKLAAVDDILTQAAALGRPLVRMPAFLDIGDSPARLRDDRGALREEGLRALDQILARAEQRGVRLVLILTNNWEDFGGASAVLKMASPGEPLPKNAFWSDERALRLQLAYQDALVGRINSVNQRAYATDPTIVAWELANEARCERERTPTLCDEQTLARWARRMSDGLRAAGARQLIAWGGSGYLGEYGEDLRSIATTGGVDVLTLHLYQTSAPDAEAAIQNGEGALRERAGVAREAKLPLWLEEVNWKPSSGDRDAERATVLSAWLNTARELDMGSLPWMIGEPGRTDYDGYLIRPEDMATNTVLRCD